MKYFKKADNALDVDVNKLSTIGNQSLIVKNTGSGDDNDIFISNSGLRKAKFRSTADNSLGVSTLAPFSVFKVDGGENLVPEPKIVDVSFVTNYDTLQIEGGFVYGSEAKANLIDIHKIIIESEQEIQLTDYIDAYGLPGRYGYLEYGHIGYISDYLEYIDFITPNKIDITKLFVNFLLNDAIDPIEACFYLRTSIASDQAIYEITQTFTGRTKLGDPVTVDVNDENVTIDYDQLSLEGYTENMSVSDNIAAFTDLSKECNIIYDGEITDTLWLGVYVKSNNVIGIEEKINELISLGDITYNDNIITIPEGLFGVPAGMEGFYCLFNVNFSDDGTPPSINLVPSSYIAQETVINENPYHFETEGEHEVEFEYANKFYPALVYPRTHDYFSNSCIIELNDNFCDYYYEIITYMSSETYKNIEKINVSNNASENAVDYIISSYYGQDNNIKEINITTDKYISVDNCLIDRNSFALMRVGGDAIVPSYITQYAHGSCMHNKGLTSIKFLNNYNVTECPSFWGCENLKYVTLPNSMKIDLVDSYDDNKFDFCPNIEEFNGKYASDDKKLLIVDNVIISSAGDEHINIPNNVNRIGVASFRGRTNLKSITIPDSVTSIGSFAVDDCDALTTINISAKALYGMNYGIYDLTNTYTNNVNFYENNNLINAYKDDVIIPDSVTSIGNYAFYNCPSLTSVNIPDSVTSIGNYAFKGCSNLTSVTIGNGVTSIENDAFAGCSKLTSVNISSLESWLNIDFIDIDSNPLYSAKKLYLNGQLVTDLVIPDSVTSIKRCAFNNCSNLTTVNIPDSVTSIGDYAFYNCSNLTSVNIPDSVTSIGYNAFYGCSNLTSVTIPDSVTSIGKYAFRGCSSLTSVNIPDSVTSIGEDTFSYCSGLTSINIPDSVTSIGQYAFQKCSNLISVEIPDSVTSIGGYAFADCSSLTSVEIPDSVTSIGGYAFRGCSDLTSVTIGNGVTSIRNYTFQNCSNLTSVTIGNNVTSIEGDTFGNCTSLSEITCYAMIAPTVNWRTFQYVKTGGVLKVPTGATGYDAWLSTSNYYLGKYGWSIEYFDL